MRGSIQSSPVLLSLLTANCLPLSAYCLLPSCPRPAATCKVRNVLSRALPVLSHSLEVELMSTESIGANEAAAAQEFPDRIGFKPDNPFLAKFRPYIPASAHLRELTPIPLIMGTVLGIIFGASSLYLVLKVGLTVSASIPV